MPHSPPADHAHANAAQPPSPSNLYVEDEVHAEQQCSAGRDEEVQHGQPDEELQQAGQQQDEQQGVERPTKRSQVQLGLQGSGVSKGVGVGWALDC